MCCTFAKDLHFRVYPCHTEQLSHSCGNTSSCGDFHRRMRYCEKNSDATNKTSPFLAISSVRQTDFGQPVLPTLAKSDFGQTDLGQKNLTDFGQFEVTVVGQTGFDMLKLAEKGHS